MIVITGAAGFIASFLAQELNLKGRNDLILVDNFSHEKKEKNHMNISCLEKVLAMLYVFERPPSKFFKIF